MPKVRLFQGKPIMVGGKVALSDDCCTPCTGGGSNGACCKDGDCSITTLSDCDSIGGTYQGDGTTCDSVDCGTATSGACCNDGDCSVLNPADCASSGGTYQGDGTDCEPNPCPIVSSCCVFSYQGFVNDPPNFYRTQTITVTETVGCETFGRSGSNSYVRQDTQTFDEFCGLACTGETGGTSDCSGFACATPPSCHKEYTCDGWSGGSGTCFGLFDSDGLGWCPAGPFVIDSDTSMTMNGDCDCGGDESAHVTVTIELSGLCIRP